MSLTVDHQKFSADVVKDIGLYTQKILVTLNAGAIVTLLAFIANISNSETVAFNIDRLKLEMLGFLVGLCFVGVSLFTTYLEAQKVVADLKTEEESIGSFMFLMTTPLILSFLAFLVGTSLAILSVEACG